LFRIYDRSGVIAEIPAPSRAASVARREPGLTMAQLAGARKPKRIM